MIVNPTPSSPQNAPIKLKPFDLFHENDAWWCIIIIQNMWYHMTIWLWDCFFSDNYLISLALTPLSLWQAHFSKCHLSNVKLRLFCVIVETYGKPLWSFLGHQIWHYYLLIFCFEFSSSGKMVKKKWINRSKGKVNLTESYRQRWWVWRRVEEGWSNGSGAESENNKTVLYV